MNSTDNLPRCTEQLAADRGETTLDQSLTAIAIAMLAAMLCCAVLCCQLLCSLPSSQRLSAAARLSMNPPK